MNAIVKVIITTVTIIIPNFVFLLVLFSESRNFLSLNNHKSNNVFTKEM